MCKLVKHPPCLFCNALFIIELPLSTFYWGTLPLRKKERRSNTVLPSVYLFLFIVQEHSVNGWNLNEAQSQFFAWKNIEANFHKKNSMYMQNSTAK